MAVTIDAFLNFWNTPIDQQVFEAWVGGLTQSERDAIANNSQAIADRQNAQGLLTPDQYNYFNTTIAQIKDSTNQEYVAAQTGFIQGLLPSNNPTLKYILYAGAAYLVVNILLKLK